MPDIPVDSPLSYVGIFLLILGLFLLLAGLGIFKIEKVTVTPGKMTWGFGLVLVVVGLIFLLPDIVNSIPQTQQTTIRGSPVTPTPTTASRVTAPTLPPTQSANAPSPSAEAPTEAGVTATGILLHTTLDSIAAVTSPMTGTRGRTTLAATDFIPAQVGNGASFVEEGRVVIFPVASGDANNIDLSRGELEFWYRPDWVVDDAGSATARTLFRVARDGYNPPAMMLQIVEGELRLTVTEHFNDDSGYHVTGTGSNIPLWRANDWVRLRVGWDRMHSTDSLRIWVDGERKDFGGVAGGWDLEPQDIEIGQLSLFIGAQTGEGHFIADGVIDELTIRETGLDE